MRRVSPWVVVLLPFFLFFLLSACQYFPFSSEHVVFILLVFDFISLPCDGAVFYDIQLKCAEERPNNQTNARPPKPKDLFSSHL